MVLLSCDQGYHKTWLATKLTIPLQIAAAERAAFVQAARGELATDRLDLPPPPPPPTSAALLPGGTLTFLFTDIEGSTRLWEQQPDAMRAALARQTPSCATQSPRTAARSSSGWGMPCAWPSPPRPTRWRPRSTPSAGWRPSRGD